MSFVACFGWLGVGGAAIRKVKTMKKTKLMECGEKLLNENKVERAVACFTKAGKMNPIAWVELACIYGQGIGVAADHARAKRFERRAHEVATRNRDMTRRFERQQRNPYDFNSYKNKTRYCKAA